MESRAPTPPDTAESEKDPELVRLGQRVRHLRHAGGMTQETLAEAAGFHWSYVGQIERGERNPTYKNLLRVARGLGVPPGRVVQDDPKR
jgi:transcriptional regulator with XRE-family HTH domain